MPHLAPEIGARRPLSLAQERLWFLGQLAPSCSAFNLSYVAQLRGHLDIDALGESLDDTVRRHDILRSTFVVTDGRAVQVITPDRSAPVPLIDLREIDSAKREAEVHRLVHAEVHRPFELATDPLLRATVLRLDETEHVFVLVTHGIVADDRSMGLLLQELSLLYSARISGRPGPFLAPPVEYADYATRQRRTMQDAAYVAQEEYWTRKLAGAPAVLDLFPDRPRPAVQTFHGDQHALHVPEPVWTALMRLSRQEGVTPFVTLLAAFQTLLLRRTAQTDLVIGVPSANRASADTASLCGPVATMLAIRCDLTGNPSFRQLLRRTREAVLDARAHQDVPFERLVEMLRPERSLSYAPLFQVTFDFHHRGQPTLDLQGVTVQPLGLARQTGEFDLSLALAGTEQGVRGYLAYNTDLFDASTIERIGGHFQTVLQGIVAYPMERLSELPLLTDTEQRLRRSWNATRTAYPQDRCIHHLVEAQVERTPEAVAVVCREERLTYAELNRRANQIAHHLQGLGVGPESIVAICMERSLELVVGLLAIVKAGGAYLPLDPAYPKEPLGFMLEDARASVLLTQERFLEALPEHGAHVVCLDTAAEHLPVERQENPRSEATSRNLAYVIYTSGSTGRPKGVAIEHRSTVALLDWARTAFPSDQLAGVLASTSVCFDLSVFELFVPLSWGGTAILADNALQLPAMPAAGDVTLINTVPSVMAELLRAGGVPASVRTINLAGEPLTNDLAQQVYQQDTIESVVNLYGPSEDTTYSTFALVQKGAGADPPIGRPVANTQVHLLDRNLKPVPVGVPGELYVGGAGLARGYLHRPDLTAERFVPHPFPSIPGERLYRTGDLARYRPDGSIEFLGRIDHQVKIRGFRIELGEIEAALRRLPAVQDAVVTVDADGAGDKRLVAHVVPSQGAAPSGLELRELLQQTLPAYMVPAAFVVLSELPLTLNGKVDRRALPAPDTARREPEQRFVASRTPIEEVLRAIWQDVLHIEQIGIHDDFFALGGHSLKAAQVVARMRGALDVELPLETLFRNPTVAGLAATIETARLADQCVQLPPIRPTSREHRIPLSFAQQSLWFLDQLAPGSAAYNIPIAFHVSGPLDVTALEHSLTTIVRRHETLRTSFAPHEGQPYQVVAHAEPLALPVVDLSALPPTERDAQARVRVIEETSRPFDLSHHPLLRALLLRTDEDEHLLVLTMHHIVSDGWSMSILCRELAAVYEASRAGTPPSLPELPVQYADYAVWQRQWLHRETLQPDLDYWARQLGGSLPVLDLPADRPRPATQTFRGARHPLPLPDTLVAALRTLSRQEGMTLYMTLLAAFQTLLHRYTGQEDIVLGTPIANRSRPELEAIIGFFVNTLVLRTDLSGNPTFQALLRRVRAVVLDTFMHQQAPFDLVVDQVQPERDLSHNPLFQVVFSYQNTPPLSAEFADLALRPVEIDNGTSKFDLTLFIVETEDSVSAVLEYNTDLFDAATVARMADHFRTLLEGVMADPGRRIAEIPLLTGAERLRLGSRSAAPLAPSSQCIHDLFAAQAIRTPDAVAIVYDDQRLTYRDLNEQANQLAHCLREMGVGPEICVGICVERSMAMVVGLLGILKAGGAYVPLDPAYPQDRLAYMLENTEIPVLLTQARLRDQLPSFAGRVVCLDADWDAIAGQSREDPVRLSGPDNLAYVIYTSGSTGRPKGALVSHRNVVRLFTATEAWYHFDQDDVWTLFHSFAFDFSVWELWGALLYGGRLVVVPYWVSRSPDAFHALLRRERVTVLNQTPSAFRQLMRVDETDEERALALRLVIFGGEALDIGSLRPWFDRHGERYPQLVNMYGITETTVHVTYRPLRAADADLATASIIGVPIPDLDVYVLDSHGQPVPIGVPGELHVGGMGLARGYCNQPGLTAERFVPHPFGEVPGARLYRTGDLARYLPSGDLEYLGRIDRQVKIRGFRIELGEIEAVLGQHESVREAVVVARDDGHEEKHLVAYLVLHESYPVSPTELRTALNERLPDYMVPAAFVVLDALPLTSSGKVDLSALPALDGDRPVQDAAYAAPRTPVEAMLASIWAGVLGLERVGVHDNYFEVGGDSIRSIQILARAADRGYRFTLPQLFQHQTIADLAQVLEVAQSHPDAQEQHPPFSLIRVEDRERLPPGVEDAYPLTMLQEGMLFHTALASDHSIYHNITTLNLRAPFERDVMERALEQLMAAHPVLRTAFDLHTFSEPLQLVHTSVRVPLEVGDLRSLASAQQETVLGARLESEKTRPFDWTQPPLFRCLLHRRTEDSFQWTLVEHHSILDGWSVASLLARLFTLYMNSLDGDGSHRELSPAMHFRDFVALERETVASDEAQRYWSDTLHDAEKTRLPRWTAPTSLERTMGPREYEWSVPISCEVSDGLKRLARDAGVPIKTVLLAAHLRVMSLLGGQTDVLTGLVANGRPERSEAEKTLGLFLNTVPLRLRLQRGTWRDLVRETFAAEQALSPYRRYPLAAIQTALGGESLFEAAFNFTHFHVLEDLFHLDGLQVLEHREFGRTNFTLVADCGLDVSSSRVQMCLMYDPAALDRTQIGAIGGYYAAALAAMASEPSRRYEQACLLPPEERQRILVEWNETRVACPQATCLQHLFEAQVARTPDALAVRHATVSLTYQELNERADRVAHHLQSLGVGPEVAVGVCLERTPAMLVALLGILKAGGAYVPLDPAYPQDRVAFMLADAQAPLLLTERSLVATLPAYTSQILCLESLEETLAQRSDNSTGGVNPANLAYIIYTSGSTGRPKGVAITHQSAVALLAWAHGVFPPSDLAGVLASTSLCFDLSVFELFVPLTAGGSVILVENALHIPHLDGEDVTLLNTVPSVLTQVLAGNALPPSIRTVNLAGEPLPQQLVQQIAARGTGARVLNLYGPTEDTTYSTWSEVSPHTSPTIGRPIANTQVYVLDAALQPVPIGVPGELYLGGAGLARGYLHRPDLTAERFVPHPFASSPGQRLYRTGDLVRWRAAGELEYLGRGDTQVKVRGFRIELGEIEAVLVEHPAVRECVVVVREDVPGDQRLVAYLVADLQNDDVGHPALTREWETEQITHWTQVYDETYDRAAVAADPTFNIEIWINSYTGQPIPAAEMPAWVEETVARLHTLAPRRVLEIGCGTGLLLFRLAPACERYWGTDVSPRVTQLVQQQVAQRAAELPSIMVTQRAAHDFDGIAPGAVDTVILNSVVQYFPSMAYLVRVLEEAVRSVSADGHVFVGDVRSLPLLTAFHASVQLEQAAATITRTELRRRVHQRVRSEEELAIDPSFFVALAHHIPRISAVEIQLKRGHNANELTAFRYDVVLHVGGETVPEEVAWLDWQQEGLTVAVLREVLTGGAPHVLGLRGVPNARVTHAAQALAWLEDTEGPETAGALRQRLEALPEGAIDPEDLWALGAELEYDVHIGWDGSDTEGRFAAIFRQRSVGMTPAMPASLTFPTLTELRPWNAYGNNPLHGKMAQALVPELRRRAQAHLPDYMVPATYVLLEALPLTLNGKVDRRALPNPEERPVLDTAYVAPQTGLEQAVAGIWREVLQVDKVGLHDNFFDLGGHSLLVMQVYSKLCAGLHVTISVVDLFRYPTIGALVQYLSRDQVERPSFGQVLDRAERQKEALQRQKEAMLARRRSNG